MSYAKPQAASVGHKAICQSCELALDWLILQGYTKRAAERLITEAEGKDGGGLMRA